MYFFKDKGIKTKAEKDRRVKELNEKNVKIFVEERKRLATKCRRHEEQLEKHHIEQMEALDKESYKVKKIFFLHFIPTQFIFRYKIEN